MIEEPNSLAEKLLSKALKHGATEAEIYISDAIQYSISYIKEHIDSISYRRSVAIGIRVAIGKKIAVQGATVSSLKEAEEVVLSAIKIARASTEDPYWKSLPVKLSLTPTSEIYDKKVDDINLEELAKRMKFGIDEMKNVDPRIKPIGSSLSISKGRRVITNNYGDLVNEESTLIAYGISAKAVEAGNESSYYEYVVKRHIDDIDIEGKAKEVASTALQFLNIKRIPTGKYEILFKNKVFSQLLVTLLAPAISAQWVQMARSPLAGKIGEQLLNEELTIIDDGTIPRYVASRGFDDEGVATKRKTVFDHGVLKTFLYDTYTAYRDNRESTGNAYRRRLSSAPQPWITNLIVQPGKTGFNEIIREMKRGIVVYLTIGEWLSNPVNGYLNATVSNGLYVENGEVKHAVKGIAISGNFYEMLKKNLIMIGSDVDNMDNVYAPSILIGEVQIIG